jgi:hypothetical protein
VVDFSQILPLHGASSSEQYFLYDTAKGPVGNRAYTGGSEMSELVGLLMYPVTRDGKAGDNVGLPDDQIHDFNSTFYWASDSSAVAFADSLNGVLSVVLASIDGDSVHTYARAVSPKEMCDDPQGKLGYAILSGARITSWPNHTHDVYIDVRNAGCRAHSIAIPAGDFEPAKINDQ